LIKVYLLVVLLNERNEGVECGRETVLKESLNEELALSTEALDVTEDVLHCPQS
jgi:hypothetical protein